jgi:hypothetical protein
MITRSHVPDRGERAVSITDIRLDVVRAARSDVVKALTADLARAGWKLGEPGPADDERAIGLVEIGEWIVIDDQDGEDVENWPQRMAVALKTCGIRMRGYPDFGSLYVRRWNGRSIAGTIDVVAKPKKFVDASFLADLAKNTKGRTALKRISMADVDEAFEAISRNAALPAPREFEELRFKKPFEKSLFAHDPRTRHVVFEESIHLRGFTGRDVMVLVASALKSKGRVPSRDGGRRFFVHESNKWVSFGEVLGDDPLRVRWPKVLARELRTPVLVVRTVEKVNAEIELWTGDISIIRKLPADIQRPREGALMFDVRWLAPLLGAAAKRPVVVGAAVGPLAWAGEARTVVWSIADRLDLPHPILEGRYRGNALSFGMPKNVMRTRRTLH